MCQIGIGAESPEHKLDLGSNPTFKLNINMILSDDLIELVKIHKEYFNLSDEKKLEVLGKLHTWIIGEMKKIHPHSNDPTQKLYIFEAGRVGIGV